MDIIITKEFTSKSGLGGLRLLAKARIKLNELTAIICEQVQDNSVGGMGHDLLNIRPSTRHLRGNIKSVDLRML